MTTVSKEIAKLADSGAKVLMGMESDLGCFEVGAVKSVIHGSDQLTSTYALMIGEGLLPTDYLSHKNKESTASKEQYEARLEAIGMVCYTKPERAELATKLPKDARAIDKEARKVLQDRRTEKLKTIRRGLTTAHKNAHPEEYKSGGANEPKTAIEDLGALMEKAIKLLQGDKPFPDTFAHDDAVAVLKGFQKTFC
tara:strand:- start:22 stop:609 length:588 start_codon:yes stop_codon:yes gene_type:complete